MELKKSNKANLENKKVLFLEIGLVVALSVMIFAFEYRSYDKGNDEQVIKRHDVAIESIEIPQTETPPPPEPEDIPPAEPTVFEIVDETVKIDNAFDVTSLFSNQTNTGVTINKKEISNDDELKEEEEIFQVVETQAEFPFPEGYMGYVQSRIVYPEAARTAGISGNVVAQFVIEKDGSLSNIKILRDIGGGCGEEVVRILKGMPKWKPAQQRGKPVRNQFSMRVSFDLN
ncbi:MAG: energy transducer TonB [Bacteroidales bacterium]|jgi:protein TonB|nr:energy transducer TonB [Bacteroidales bacterium]